MTLSCKSCGSDKQYEFVTEMPVVSPKIEDLGKPLVWVFPRLFVCLTCGYAEFKVPEPELRILRDNTLENEAEPSTQGKARQQ